MTLNYQAARINMLESQIRPNRVTHPLLLDALENTPRELFVAADQQSLAYHEGEVAVAAGRTLLPPMILARMIEALELTKDDKLLDIGCATGYGTVIISHLTGITIGLESDAQLANQAVANLQRMNIATGAMIQHGPLSLGAKDFAPFSAVFVNGALPEIPAAFFNQLDDGGRLIAIIGGRKDMSLGQVTLFTKHHGSISQRVLFEAAASYLPGFVPVEGFKF